MSGVSVPPAPSSPSAPVSSTLSPSGEATPWATRIKPALRQALGREPDAIGPITPVAADASARVYVRVPTNANGRPQPGEPDTLIAMLVDPADFTRVEEASGDAPPEDMPFLDIARFLGEGAGGGGRQLPGLGLPVPQIYAVDREQGVVLLSDLGDTTLYTSLQPLLTANPRPADGTVVRAELLDRYENVLNLLVEFQSRVWRAASLPRLIAERRFDAPLLAWELWHFVRWLLIAEHGVEPSPSEGVVIRRDFDRLVAELTAAPQRPVHRDWQSRNLMVTPPTERHPWGLSIIDFQDMLTGPAVYDVVSLLRDSYVALTPAEVTHLARFWATRARQAGLLVGDLALSDEALLGLIYRQALQRKLKDAGRFVFIRDRKGNPNFMRHVPSTLRYLREIFDALPEYTELRAVLARYLPELAP